MLLKHRAMSYIVLLLSTEFPARISSATMPSSSEIISSSIILVVLAVPGNMSKLIADETWSICTSHWVALGVPLGIVEH